MTIMQAIFLGIIQGLTEFLPVSSSGHLVFLPKLFGWTDQGLAFDVVIHMGTLLAVVIYFRERLLAIFKGFFSRGKGSKMSRRLGWLLVLSIIPAGLAGYFGDDYIQSNFRSTTIIGITLIFWGAILWIADWYAAKQKDTTDTTHMSWKQVVFISFAQALALIPGTSRSGITMTAGLFSKLDKKNAAEFSFLMSVPVIAVAGAYKLLQLMQTGLGDLSAVSLSAGLIASAVSGLFAIKLLLKIIEKWSFAPFAMYRIIVGIIILLLV